MHRRIWIAATLLLAACSNDVMAPSAPSADARSESHGSSDAVGRVYTLTNAVSGNAVLAFPRGADGVLGASTSYATGGSGTGAGLGSQGAVILNDAGTLLFAVNAGSNEITSFRVTHDGLDRVGSVPSGGLMPISVTTRGGLLYALNAGGAGNISGFRIDQHGALSALAGSTRSLGGAATGPAQVSFSPDGRVLVVTEKAANSIATYVVGHSGTPSAPIINVSSGETPFGFTFDQHGTLIVTEAFGGAPNASAASSYRILEDGRLSVISASVKNNQTSACWFAITNSGRYAYAALTGSAAVAGYAVHDGRLSLLDADGRTAATGSAPADLAMSENSQFLYVRNGDSNSISAFHVSNGSGALTPIEGVAGLPAGSVGLAAR